MALWERIRRRDHTTRACHYRIARGCKDKDFIIQDLTPFWLYYLGDETGWILYRKVRINPPE